MDNPQNLGQARLSAGTPSLPLTVIIAARKRRICPAALEGLRGVGEVYVIDSQSTDATVEVSRSHEAQVVQFYYQGGWPKKRQWAIDTLPIAYDWILLLDADEALELAAEIRQAIQDPARDGYYLALQQHFLGHRLKHSGAGLWKLALLRRGKGHYECRLLAIRTHPWPRWKFTSMWSSTAQPQNCGTRLFTTTWNPCRAIYSETRRVFQLGSKSLAE